MCKFKIFQTGVYNDYCFRSWNEAKEKFDMEDYLLIYESTTESKENNIQILEGLFFTFNMDHPSDYYGRSLSVSDVVALKRNDDDNWEYYYCDNIGWVNINKEREN